MITIKRCFSKQDLHLFERTPEILYGDSVLFTPPYPGSVVKLFHSASPHQRNGLMTAFLAFRKNKIVGRIAAIINSRHDSFYGLKVGFFGFFDFTEDLEVASCLFNSACKFLRAKGYSTVEGPFNPSINDECGLLVEGFDKAPMIMMPYNPPYYASIYEKIGLKTQRNLLAFYISTKLDVPTRIVKIAERTRKKSELTLRCINLEDLTNDLNTIMSIYNSTLDRNSNFIPISQEELAYVAKDLKSIIDPPLVLFAEKDGVPVGFSLSLPNINEFLRKTKAWPRVLRPLNLLWSLLTGRPKEIRVIALGVTPKYRKTGLAALLYAETLIRSSAKYRGGELSWIEDNNEEIIKGAILMGAEKYKTYRLYQFEMEQHAR